MSQLECPNNKIRKTININQIRYFQRNRYRPHTSASFKNILGKHKNQDRTQKDFAYNYLIFLYEKLLRIYPIHQRYISFLC